MLTRDCVDPKIVLEPNYEEDDQRRALFAQSLRALIYERSYTGSVRLASRDMDPFTPNECMNLPTLRLFDSRTEDQLA